jgi:transcriptional regulator with XRE-family HTH domain
LTVRTQNKTRASVLLLAVEKTQAAMADDLETTQQNVSNWRSGRTRPAIAIRVRIESMYKISARLWLFPEELSALGLDTSADCETRTAKRPRVHTAPVTRRTVRAAAGAR